MPRKQLRPPIKLRKKFAPLIELCRNKILTAPSQTSGTDSGDKLITIVCRWPTKQGAVRTIPDIPEDFPTGVVLERSDESITIRHNVVALLKWLKAKHYTTYDASDLFAMRLPVLMRLAKLELKLDRMLEGVDVEQHHEELIDDNEDSEYNARIG